MELLKFGTLWQIRRQQQRKFYVSFFFYLFFKFRFQNTAGTAKCGNKDASLC